jgi:hypothetical protein
MIWSTRVVLSSTGGAVGGTVICGATLVVVAGMVTGTAVVVVAGMVAGTFVVGALV